MFFFDFVMDVLAKTPSFESISGRQSSKKALKARCFRCEVHEKSKKHHAIAPIATTPRKVPGREHIDCENTMNMKSRLQKL